MAVMWRTTLMLPVDLKERAALEARARGVSLGELIRQALQEKLTREPYNRARDPFFADDRPYDGPAPTDASVNLDEYLYGDGV